MILLTADAREQFRAIALVRWQLFFNSLRTLRGRLEMVSRVFIGVWFAIGGLGGAIALGGTSFFFLRHDHADWIAFLLWPVFLFWQLFPIVATAFTENFDSSNLLRFPLSYPAFFMVRVVYGSLDPATAVGTLWLLGLFAGISAAQPHLFLSAAFGLLVFAVVNILLARMIFAWIERWLAQRRTREIMGVVFLLLIISFQFIGPLMAHLGRQQEREFTQFGAMLLPIERLLPPGLTASVVAESSRADFAAAISAFLVLGTYGIVFLWLLNIRLRAQYRGENLSEAVARRDPNKGRIAVRAGWGIPLLSGPTAAIFEKELRYLARSGPMLFTLLIPVFFLLVVRLTPAKLGETPFISRAPNLVFPIGAAYALLMLTNFVYNNFGADAVGVQVWFVSPVRFRQIVRAKNIVHATILILEMLIVWIAVSYVFQPPSLSYTVATLAAVLFAAPVNFSAGNLLSLYAPKKFDYGTFGRQRAANTTAFVSFLVQGAAFGIVALAFLAGRFLGGLWITTLILLALAAVASVSYLLVLRRIDTIALARRESLIAELSRA